MHDNTLLKISLFLSVGGIIALFFILQVVDIEATTIRGIENKTNGDFVKVYGQVDDVIARGTVTSFSLKEIRKLDAVVFDNLSLEEGLYVELEGKISEEDGQRQIIVDTIRIR
ncbi:MAG: hypothetical protein ABIE94_03535 [archaeon]